ncbi:hypothetical protein [Gordonia sp. (in: high G+C Gram-positive bacteria)]|uniref:hypothetical protein n=1 Tax=Gordonia sp. (in: high G+C Gram-positive bacteria) TaxID=84139 RepID=UPI00261C55AB|nr:hypothetical protein [Gordonia sp. (in: high G+C Gram-positive bacteria)]
MAQRHMNRAARRRAHKDRRRTGRATRTAVTLGATTALGLGLLGGVGAVRAESPLDALGDLGGITALLDNDMIKDFIEVCQNPDGSTPVPDAEHPPVAVADCSQSTGGTGVAVVLPDSVEIAPLLENYKVPDGTVLVGGKNMIEMISGLAIGGINIVAVGLALGEFKTFDEVLDAATRAPEMVTVDTCNYLGVVTDGKCAKVFGVTLGTPGTRTYDKNADRRDKAVKVAEYLTNGKFDPAALGQGAPSGTATVKGDGMKVALAMRGGHATAVANTLFGLPGVALAGADHGQTSTATSQLGFATALNMDTDQIKLTYFGQELDFTKLKNNDLVSGLAGDQLGELDEIEKLQKSIPALKEVSCYGVNTTATAEGLGTCSNYLGTFDYYQDLRAAKAGESRQTQYGLTDVSSLVFGNDALLKQFGLLGGSESTAFMDSLLPALTSEDQRLKFAKDFVRFTQDVRTENVMEQAADADGNLLWVDADGRPVAKDAPGALPKMQVKQRPVMIPVMVQAKNDDGSGKVDENGKPVMVQDKNADGSLKFEEKKDSTGKTVMENVTETVTAAWLTSDYGLREPITIEWMGQKIVLFPAVEVNGTTRPNLIGAPEITKIVNDSGKGLLPKVSLVQIDNAFGLGTLSLDNPFDPITTIKSYLKTVTLDDDLKEINKLVQPVIEDAASGLVDDAKSGLKDLPNTVTDSLPGLGGTTPPSGAGDQEQRPTALTSGVLDDRGSLNGQGDQDGQGDRDGQGGQDGQAGTRGPEDSAGDQSGSLGTSSDSGSQDENKTESAQTATSE